MKYTPRVADNEIKNCLLSTGAVVIEGPKACGKTTTAREFAASELLLDIDENARQAIKVDPKIVLGGKTPRLIDEWQIEPVIWNHIRREVDSRKKPGQFILTGSSVPSDNITRHTGAGRLTRVKLRPMTLFETGHSNGAVSLKDLLEGEAPQCKDPGLTLEDIIACISAGGWPINLGLDLARAVRAVKDYLEEIRRVDIQRVDGTRHDPEKVGMLLRSLARNISTPVAATTLASDIPGADGPLHNETVGEYLEALSRIMILEDQPAWAPHLRSRIRLRKSPKRHFVDPSLAVAALGATPKQLSADLNFLGLLFESLVVRDLRVFAQAEGAKVFHYRDETKLEIDAVVECSSGKWGAFEIKLGTGRIEEAAGNLLKFAGKIDTAKTGKPAVLGIITGNGYGYRRDDGICVIPAGSLRH